MAILGLSIILASVSCFFYKHPPSGWRCAIRDWLGCHRIEDVSSKYASIPLEDRKSMMEETVVRTSTESHVGKSAGESTVRTSIKSPLKTSTEADTAFIIAKAEIDRRAMPPPSLSLKKPASSPTTPRASTSSASYAVPKLALSEADEDQDCRPSFPAANSAQRASRAGAHEVPRTAPQHLSGATVLKRNPPGLSPLRAPAKPRQKAPLTAGHSPLDWARLTTSSTNLTGLPLGTAYLRVPPSLLGKYTGRRGKDAWTQLGGKVYNITPYIPYHPGGETELLRCAGRDGTRLFAEVHPWVNWAGMLAGCLVGVAVDEDEAEAAAGTMLDEMD